MNVSLINNDSVRGIIKLEIVKSDYEGAVEKELRHLRQKANYPGFRKGMVPMNMIKKMYGKHVLVDEVNKIVGENLFKYIRENNLNILGEPLASEAEPSHVDFDTQEDFIFNFDVALAPEINITLSKDDVLPYYQVKIDEDLLNKQVEAYTANFGTYEKVEDAEEKDLVKGTIAELENGTPKEGGIVVENAVLMPHYIKDEAEKAKFIGAKVNSVVVFNPNKAFEGAEAEISGLLHVDKEKVAELTGDFSFEIKELTRLFRQLMVHLLRLRNQFLRRSFRNRVSFRENQLLIVIMQPVHSKPFLLLLPKLQAEWYNLLLHLRTEPCDILRRIIVSSIAQVNKFNVRRKSQLLRNFIAQRNHLVIQRIQLPGNLFIQISPCRHRLFPHLAVRTLHRLQQSIKITRFALKFRRSIRRNFAVLLHQIRLFNQILHDTVVR